MDINTVFTVIWSFNFAFCYLSWCCNLNTLLVVQLKSIAVLPFINLSADPENEYFSDGITEEIINALTKVASLKVTARTSSFAFKGKDQDIREIARTLGVANVLEGSVRKAGKRIRITAQLIQASDGFHLWSRNFDRELADIFVLQDEISLLIADQIRENFGHIEIKDQLVDQPTSNVEAYQQFLKGRFYQLNWKLEDFYRAIDFYKLSIRLDPVYYQPYFGLVQCYGILASWNFMDKDEALKKAGKYLDQGMAIKADSPEGFFALATQSFWINWQVEQALAHLRNALNVSPHDTEALESCAECYTAVGRFDEATSCINQALDYNPLSANHHYTKGNIYYLSGQYDQATNWMNKALAIDPKWDLAWQVKACCTILMHDKDALYDILDKHPGIDNKSDFVLLFEIHNEGKEAQEADFLRDHTGYLPWEVYIPLYLGDTQGAVAALRNGIDHRLGQYINFMHDPMLHTLKGNAEYEALCDSSFSFQSDTKIVVEKEAATQPKLTDEEVTIFIDLLKKVMSEGQLYLNSNLTLRSLADAIKLHPNKLSWLLNEKVSKNFNDFVNEYRVQAFQARALDPANQHLSLLGIAYESGFNSKSVFNHFFKKSTGTTPRQWLKQKRSKK